MKLIVVINGNKSCNKNRFINLNKLEKYVFNINYINIPVLSIEDKLKRNSSINDKIIELLEYKMKKGDLIILKNNRISNEIFANLVYKYNYKLIYINTDTNTAPKKFFYLKNDTLIIKNQIYNFSSYKKIHHIGDIHGCYSVLKEYFKQGLNKNELYIFTGDYIDRGFENIKVIKFLLKIYKYKNVILLEGNHEINLFHWANDNCSKMKKNFLKTTKKELEDSNISKQDIKNLFLKMKKAIIYEYNEKLILVTHGGLSNIPENLIYISEDCLINGTGNDTTAIDLIFSNNNKRTNKYSIHGHRNFYNIKINEYSNSFNLEGGVEFGEYLRICILDKYGFKFKYLRNKHYILKNYITNLEY